MKGKRTISKDKEVRAQHMLPYQLHKALKKLPLIFIPLAPLEWHGLHLAIGTDPINAEHVARELAKRIGGVVLPTLYMGTERERDPETLEDLGVDKKDYVFGMNFPKAKGLYKSFYFPEEIFALVLRAQIKLCVDHGYKYIYIVSGHGATNHLEVIDRLSIEFSKSKKGVRVGWGVPFPVRKEEAKAGGIVHAGIEETSLMMHYGRKLVDLKQLPSTKEKLYYQKYSVVDGEAFLGKPAEDRAVPKNFDPRIHSSEKLGEKIFKETIENLTKDIFKTFNLNKKEVKK